MNASIEPLASTAPPAQSLSRRLVAEALGTALLLASIVGSGIMAERLAVLIPQAEVDVHAAAQAVRSDTGREADAMAQPEGRCNDVSPAWLGGTVFFLSDRDGEFNLYSFEPGSASRP